MDHVNVAEIQCTVDNTINITDGDSLENWVYTSEDKLLTLILVIILLLVGVFGNGMFLLTVYRVKRMQTFTNAFLCNIAVSDLILLSYIIFLFIVTLFMNIAKGGVPFTTSQGCVLFKFFGGFPYFLSSMLITLVSLERFYAICLPLSTWTLSRKSRTRKVIATAWISAIMLTPAVVLNNSQIHSECISWPDEAQYKSLPTIRWTCITFSDSFAFRMYMICFCAGVYAILLLVNLVIYAAIIRALSRRNVTTASGDNHKTDVVEVRNQVARLLIALGVVFFICQTPQRVVIISEHLEKINAQLLSTEKHSYRFIQELSLMSVFFLALNNVINPYLYAIFSKSYRDAYLEALNLKKNDQPRQFGTKRQSTTKEDDCL